MISLACSMHRALLVILLAICIGGCAPTPQSLTIKWDASTLRLIDAGADYGRMIRLSSGQLACVFDRGAKMWIRHSTDDGQSWGEAILVAQEKGSWLTNAYVLQLKGGQLLYFWDDRPMEAVAAQRRATTAPLTRPFRIRMARSSDQGKTWSSAQTLYAAGTRFGDGCWEPAAVELPTGEIQCYFANEGPYTQSDEQEISLVRSTDSGATWSAAEQACFRPHHRDGMPAPLLLKSHVVIAIEDNGLSGNTFKPAIVDMTSPGTALPNTDTASPSTRWSAFKEDLPATTYAGAPFLAKLPSGLTLLSFQESADGAMHDSREWPFTVGLKR